MLNTIIDLAWDAGEMAMETYESAVPMSIEEKGPLDLVTQTDRDIEDFLRTEVERLFPGEGFLGEEGTHAPRLGITRTWVVDPIDGTANFVRRSADWAISIGLFRGGEALAGVIYAPVTGFMLAGARGEGATLNGQSLVPLPTTPPVHGVAAFEASSQTSPAFQARLVRTIRESGMSCRSYGSSTISFMAVARGLADVYLGFGARSWDLMAGVAILSELGAGIRTSQPLNELHGRFNVFAGRVSEADRWDALVRARDT